jgi:hypothetical protein
MADGDFHVVVPDIDDVPQFVVCGKAIDIFMSDACVTDLDF